MGMFMGTDTGHGLLQYCGQERGASRQHCGTYTHGFRDAARSLGAICDQKATGDQVVTALTAALRTMTPEQLRPAGIKRSF